MAFVSALPNRLFGNVIWNEVLLAVPLFVFMGVMLERSKVAEELLETMGGLFGRLNGGLGISVTLVGMLLAASTGIVGATVVTMGLLSLPTMLKHGYDKGLACGSICAAGTLGQIIPPSIVLVILGDQLASAYIDAQREIGNLAPEPLSVGDLFAGALLPGLMLVGLYLLYQTLNAWLRPQSAPALPRQEAADALPWRRIVASLLPPLILIVAVLGTILAGIATPSEAAGVGAVGATLLAARRLSTARSGPVEATAPPSPSIARTAGALGGILVGAVMGQALAGAPLAGALTGAALGALIVRAGLLGRLLGAIDRVPGPRAIDLAGVAVLVLIALKAVADLRLQRAAIPLADGAAIALAILATAVLLWGLAVALRRCWRARVLMAVNRATLDIATMIFTILIGASLFSLVFRGLGGEELVKSAFEAMPGGFHGALLLVMAVMFVLGFFLDFVEITFVVVPLVAPALLAVEGVSPVWIGVLMAMNLQTSFLTPPFGFALFYLRGVTPPEISTAAIYRGVLPFVLIQLAALGLLVLFPGLANWLPELLFGSQFGG